MSGRGRSRSGPLVSSRGRGSRSASPSSSSGVKRGSRGGGRTFKGGTRLSNANRRPKFNDNPAAPEIVEKTDLNGLEDRSDESEEEDQEEERELRRRSESPEEEEEEEGEENADPLSLNMRKLLQDKMESSPGSHPLLATLKQRLEEGSIKDMDSLKNAVSESMDTSESLPHSKSIMSPSTLSNAVKDLFMLHVKPGESLAEEGLSYLKSRFAETTVVPLDQLDHNMVPVESVHIQEYRVQGDHEPKKASSSSSAASFDKSKLFSKMEDTFAKDTQQALKHKPVYTKKRDAEPFSPLDNKENERLKNGAASHPRSSPSPPHLLPEMEVRSHYVSPFRNNSERSHAPDEEEEEGGDPSLPEMDEEPPRMWPAVLSRMDAETAAMALQFTLLKPSLKTVIRVPPSASHPPPHPSSHPSKKKKSAGRVSKAASNPSPQPTPQDLHGDDDGHSLVIDEEDDFSPRSSPVTPQHLNHSSSLATNSSGKASSPDSHKSDEKTGPPEPMVVPEKASSFNIHPERCCSDMCHYCGLKFGMLDTPLHVSQLKTSEVRKKVEDITGFEKDACLCDKCFRFLDRRAKNAKQGDNDCSAAAAVNANADKRKKEENSRKDDRKCIVRNCNREVSENVSKKWLVRLKKKLVRKISLDWERVGRGSVKSVFPVCHKHHSWVDFYSSCGLCKKKLTVGGICTLGISKQEVHELNVLLREDRIPAELVENHFVCKLCRTFCNFKQKSAVSPEVFRNQKAQKGFCKDYKKRLYQCLRLDGGETTDCNSEGNALSTNNGGGSKTPKKIHQVSQSDNPTKITIKTTTLPLEDEEAVSCERPTRKRRGGKEVFTGSPSSIKVTESSSCSVNISFDLNTKKLWQDMHFPYGNYTAFFRHLILLEKFWRNGDLKLSETASEKSSVYIKSVYNRIRAYEGGRSNVKKSSLSSDVDLSASTRPDLSIPAAPLFLHEPPEEDEEEPKVKKDPPYKPPPASTSKDKQPEILKIPKVPLLSGSRAGMDSMEHIPQSSLDGDELSSPPTKIRVRTDLMHLGLIVKPVPNLMNEDRLVSSASSSTTCSSSPCTPSSVMSTASTLTTTPSTDITTVTPSVPSNPLVSGAKKMSPHTISSMLNDTPSRHQNTPLSISTPSPSSSSLNNLLSDPVSLTPPQPSASADKSSNNQLFMKEQSSAIPLTFNNSIAEVLEAANKATKQNSKESAVSMALASKPEITITAKPLPKQQQPVASTLSSSSSSKAVHHHPGSWIPGKAGKASSRSPILDMTKLLQTQTPGLPPHLVAQDQLKPPVVRPSNNPRMIRPQSTPVLPSTLPGGISSPLLATQQKKSTINNILDRLSGLKAATASSASGKPPSSSSSSSLVQQLQAPPVHLPSSPPRMSGPQQQAAAAAAAAQQLMWAFNPGGAAASAGSPAPGQHMVQYDWLSQTQALMMAGALPTLDQVQAAQRVQAFQELMNMGMGNKNNPSSGGSSNAPRMRAPPPLTHMGKGGGGPTSGGGASLPKSKND